jgi:hypothetical protein
MEEVLLVVMEMNERSSIQEMSFRWSDSSLTGGIVGKGFLTGDCRREVDWLSGRRQVAM